MLKLIDSDSFNTDEPSLQLVKVHSRGLEKSASLVKVSRVLQQEMDNLDPIPGHTYLHLVALNDYESMGANRNGDAFTAETNRTCHPTFVKNGHVFDNHDNKDPKKASGIVKASAYNPDMHRVELIIAVDNRKWDKELQKIASGDLQGVSMACNVRFDKCSICNNLATNPDGPCDQPPDVPSPGYCEHIKYARSKVLDDGRLVCMFNPNPTFFDISRVYRPADRGAYVLSKAAAAGVLAPLSADMAKQAGIILPPYVILDTSSDSIRRRYELLQLMAQQEKVAQAELSGTLGSPRKKLAFLLAIRPDSLSKSAMTKIALAGASKAEDLLGSLSNAHVLIPVNDFIKILLKRDLLPSEANVPKEVEGAMPGMFGEILEDDPLGFCEETLPDCPREIVDRMLGGEDQGFLADEESGARGVRISMLKEGDKEPQVSVSKMGSASVSHPVIKDIAKLYAKYSMAVLDRCKPGEENFVSRLIAIRNSV